MKKITKILPLLMSLMLVAPVFADTSTATNSASSEMDITITPFINITKTASVNSSGTTVTPDYGTLTVSTPLSATFQVINNLPNKHIYLKATCPQDGTPVSALYEYGSALGIVFGHSTRKPDSTAISDITGGSADKTQNANAFALTLTPEIKAVENTGASFSSGDAVFGNGKVDYTLTNGIYTMKYDVGTTSLADTFSTHDTEGKYTATLTLTDVTP